MVLNPFRPLQAEMIREVQRGQMQEREEAAKAVEAAALANLSRQRQVQVRVQHLFDYNTSNMHLPKFGCTCPSEHYGMPGI